LHEFDIDDNGIDFICRWKSRLASHSLVVHKDRNVIFTGGRNSVNQQSKVCEMTFGVSQISKMLYQAALRELPSLVNGRSHHASFIVRGGNYLFVAFGFTVGDVYSQTVEYLDLAEERGQFREMEIEGYDNYCSNPMVFPRVLCPREELARPTTVMYFFGGQSVKKRGPLQVTTELRQLVIDWDPFGCPKRCRVESVEYEAGKTVKVPGAPQFSQIISNKKYLREQQTWVFLEEGGREYQFS
jgi:hypothetical protein